MKLLQHLTAAALAFGMVATADAISFDISSLNTNTDPDAPGTWFSVELTTTGGATPTGTFAISNLVVPATGTTFENTSKISEVYLGVDGSFFDYFVATTGVASGTGTDFNLDESLNGGQQTRSQASWLAAAVGDPAGGSASTINPGETLSITYNLMSGVTEQGIIDAFSASPQLLGIAFHAQSLPGGYSEKYEATVLTSVPDGGTTIALFGFSLLGLGGTRRLLAKRS